MRLTHKALLLLVFAACGPNLPDGWKDARRISVQQEKCAGYLPTSSETFSATSTATSIEVDSQVQFRCNQKVEGFVREATGTIDLLVQPVDMDPGSWAACGCYYGIRASLGATPGGYAVSLYRRWDGAGDTEPSPPILVGTVNVIVP